MNNIINDLHNENWSSIRTYIEHDKIDWNYLVDQINGPIHYLAYHNKTNLIKIIPKEILFELMTQANTEADTVCHIAAKLNNNKLLAVALSFAPSTIYYYNKLLHAPLYYLVKNHHLVQLIISSIKIQDHYLNQHYSLLEYYILTRDVRMVNFLLKSIDLNKISERSLFATILSTNATGVKISLLKKLIEHKISINSLNDLFLSPLILAVYQREYSIVKFLLESGGNPNYYGPESSDNPLTIAIIDNDDAMINLLLKYRVEIDVPDKYLKTPLHYLFSSPISTLPLDLKRTLLETTHTINATDNRMESILNLLIKNDDWTLYKNILEGKKLKIYLQNKDGMAPIDWIKPNDLNDFYETVYQSYRNQLNDATIDKKIIWEKIIKGQSYPSTKKSPTSINMIRTKKTNITHYSAYTYNYICFLYHILSKYSEIKVPIEAPGQLENRTARMLYKEMIEDYNEDTPNNKVFKSIIKDYINHSPSLINHLIIWKNNQMYFFSPYIVQGIHETMKIYPDTKFILLKLTIISEKNFSHANIIIFDTTKKIIERFDPYGKVPFIDNESLDKLLAGFFSDYFPTATYLSPSQLSNGISFQIFSDENNVNNHVENDPRGFCIAWCLWYLEMRINNIQIDPKSLIRKTVYQINFSEDQFKDYIRNYSNYLDGKKNTILEKANLPKKYWYMHHIPKKFYKAYLKHIRKIFSDIL
jgi:hypothetical protein